MQADRTLRRALLVTTLGAAQAVLVVGLSRSLGAAVAHSMFGGGPVATVVLALQGLVLLAVALVTTTVVTTNLFAMLMITRRPETALRRLLGSSAKDEADAARRLIRSILLRGVLLGAVVGHVLATAVTAACAALDLGLEFRLAYLLPSPLAVLPLVAQAAFGNMAGRRAAQPVLSVQPVEALRRSGLPDTVLESGSSASGLLGASALVLAVAAVLGAVSPVAMLMALVGGLLLTAALVTGAGRLVASALRLAAHRLPPGSTAAAAMRALQQDPSRTARALLGVAVCLAVVVGASVATASFQLSVQGYYSGTGAAGEADATLGVVIATVTGMTAVLGLTAGVGFASTMEFSGRLRCREIALLRVLGQDDAQVRRAIRAESLLLGLGAAVLGLGSGSLLGWVTAQSAFGSKAPGHVVVPVIPVVLVVLIMLVVLGLTGASSARPTRAALQGAPIQALNRA